MAPITYDLRDGKSNSNIFYSRIKEFSNEVLEYLTTNAEWLIVDYKEFILSNDKELIRSQGEYFIELLTIGMIWKRYLGASQKTPKFILLILIILYKMRKWLIVFKAPIDKIRGLLSSFYLASHLGEEAGIKTIKLNMFYNLVLWLKASGEFKDEVKRLKLWYEFFQMKDEQYFHKSIDCAIDIINWFGPISISHLGDYTKYLNEFLLNKYPLYNKREDVIFCGKEEIEYHLNMVASEIMNRGLKNKFENTLFKIVLVPSCMSNPEYSCKKIKKGEDILCSMCSQSCNINHLVKLGIRHNFMVNIVPHSSSFTKWLIKWKNSKDSGIIAIACLLNITPGGYEMRELNIPSQCILLDGCGCKKHWHKTGIPTEINENRLLEILNIK
jgi:uncharacterized protein